MSRRGFTLVEMLVVIGIIGVLAALLLPAVMAAVVRARTAAIGIDIAELDKAVESYREKHQDYPPNFRDYNHFIRHVNKCYRNIDPVHLNRVIDAVWGPGSPPYSTANPPPVTVPPKIDEAESLVFWLYLVDNDSRLPFKAILVAFRIDPITYAALGAPATNEQGVADVINAPKSPEHIYAFQEARFIDDPGANDGGDYMPAYKASYSGESAYLYIDGRAYKILTDDYTDPNTAALSWDLPGAGYVRPYWSEIRANTGALTPPDLRDDYKPMNPSKFQIVCAGADGLFGADATPISLRYFPGGGGYNTSGEDNDNMTNFSEGRRLEDHIP